LIYFNYDLSNVWIPIPIVLLLFVYIKRNYYSGFPLKCAFGFYGFSLKLCFINLDSIKVEIAYYPLFVIIGFISIIIYEKITREDSDAK